MLKKIFGLLSFFVFLIAYCPNVYATPTLGAPGNIGFFGGITEGIRLPKTTETLTTDTVRRSRVADIVTPYKEVIFIDGTPIEFEGTLTIRKDRDIISDVPNGTYRVTYTVTTPRTINQHASLSRTIAFDVTWYRPEKYQIIRDFKVVTWTEEIIVGGLIYRLDSNLSFFEISILERWHPGVTYYKGNSSYRAVYNGRETVVEGNSEFYGYWTTWSHAETHILNEQVNHFKWEGNGLVYDWGMAYEVRPSVSAYKTLQYSLNQPYLISFSGNYQEILTTESGLSYNIYHLPNHLYGTPTYGTATLPTPNVFANLPFIDTTIYAAHYAHGDIARLYALNIIDIGLPVTMYNPTHLITRGEFTMMLVKALNLAIDPIPVSTNRRHAPERIVFPDVQREHPAYDYIVAAFDRGLVSGRGNGLFEPQEFLTLEESIHMIIESLGLLNLGIPTNMTPFTDHDDISVWARQAMYAGRRIGLFSTHADGTINPKMFIDKGAAAAIINRLIDYMRFELKIDYTENIVHFAR
jgi:hypothetical protein